MTVWTGLQDGLIPISVEVISHDHLSLFISIDYPNKRVLGSGSFATSMNLLSCQIYGDDKSIYNIIFDFENNKGFGLCDNGYRRIVMELQLDIKELKLHRAWDFN